LLELVSGNMLQWSHGSEAVETTSGRSRVSRGSGFNGATARRPWKLVGARVYSAATSASMEPRLGGRGNTWLNWPTLKWCACFNGATARRPWKQRHSDSSSSIDSRFNGATARRPWKQLGGKVPECR